VLETKKCPGSWKRGEGALQL